MSVGGVPSVSGVMGPPRGPFYPGKAALTVELPVTRSYIDLNSAPFRLSEG